MNFGAVLTYLACILVIFVVCKILLFPLKKIIKLLFNSLIGAVILFLVNLIGATFGFAIGINIITSLVVGILGIPGVILLVILKVFF